MGGAEETITEEGFEDGSGDVNGDDEAEVLAVSDEPAVGEGCLDGAYVVRSAGEKGGMFWVLRRGDGEGW